VTDAQWRLVRGGLLFLAGALACAVLLRLAVPPEDTRRLDALRAEVLKLQEQLTQQRGERCMTVQTQQLFIEVYPDNHVGPPKKKEVATP
jgi:hypothetical protein